MSKTQYNKLRKLIGKIEDEALNEGIDITSPDFQWIIKDLLKQRGFTLAEYQEHEEPKPKEDKPLKIEGVSRIKGDKGDRGDKGDTIKGDTGTQGTQGTQGNPGKDGKDGREGKRGRPGKIIFRGKQGEKGEKGKDADLSKALQLFEKFIPLILTEIDLGKKEMQSLKKTTSITSQSQKEMPDFRKLAMGLQGQIDANKAAGAGTVENLSSQCDGSATAFTTVGTITDVAWLSLNGTNLIETKDFTVSGNTITISTVTPNTGEELYVKYT